MVLWWLTWPVLVVDCLSGVVDSLRGNKALRSTLFWCFKLNCRLISLKRQSSSDSSVGLSLPPICSFWAIYNAPICSVRYHIRQNPWIFRHFNHCSHPRSIDNLHIFQMRDPYGLKADRNPISLVIGQTLSFCRTLPIIGIKLLFLFTFVKWNRLFTNNLDFYWILILQKYLAWFESI